MKQYLEHIKATSFGKFSQAVFGPFTPGLNVIYGSNESGKTTLNELIKGVLFRWPRGTKGANAYKPEGSERQGSLFFTSTETGKTTELCRTKNSEQPIDEFGVLDDIDEETYNTMFALTSDELMQLDRHNEITARLLTAGSGTIASPAKVLETINQRIKNKMSRAAEHTHSIVQIRTKEETLREEIQQGLQEADHFRLQEQKLKALTLRKEALTQAQNTLNEDIEKLKTQREQIKTVDEDLASATAKLAEANESERLLLTPDAFSQTTQERTQDLSAQEQEKLAALSATEELELRGYLEDASAKQTHYEHLSENARQTALKSQGDYELLSENRDRQDERKRARMQRGVKLAASVVIPLILLGCSLYLIFSGQSSLRFSYLMIAVGMLVGAVMLGAVGILVNIRPTKIEEKLDEDLHKSEWVMKQDAKNYEKAQEEEQRFARSVKEFLDAHFLTSAHGSLRQAQHVLDMARELKSQRTQQEQNRQALLLQKASLERSINDLQQKRASLLAELGFSPNASISELDAKIQQKIEERASTVESSNETYREYGEISNELEQAKFKQNFDKNKLELELLEAQLEYEYQDLARLLLAKRALETAINEWEGKSQPEVYKRASALMSEITHGAWEQVRMDNEGNIVVRDALKTTRPPQLLSLGTRQQLYLSLRIALLIMAENVGSSLPVLCDDILVNFDEERRVGAAKALVELAKHRQVLVFTCHPEIASLLKSVDSSLNYLEL